jgi:lipopolysaccharide export system permease protein
VNGAHRLLPPIISRHLVREFLRAFGLALATFIAIFVIVEFFDRVDTFLRNHASAGAIVRYFLFKLPMVVTQVTPVAVLAGGLVGLGLLARQNEFIALRSCGVSIWQVTAPLVVTAGAISVAVLVWNETVVPYAARRAHMVENLEIRRRGIDRIFAGREVWYHGRAGFYNIDRVSPRRHALYGLTVYQLTPEFRPWRTIEAESASWDGTRWQLLGVRTREFGGEGVREVPRVPEGFELPESLEDFRVVSVEAEELSYGMLRRQIEDLQRKGVDTSESWVDLHLKLALPAASLMMILIAVPMAAAGTRVGSIAASMAVGFVIGFGYFVVVAFARALGQTGALPPAVAAWAGNAVFALVGGYYLLGSD